jgi:hypothetical protein
MDMQPTAELKADAATAAGATAAGAAAASAAAASASAAPPAMFPPPAKEGNGARGIIVGLGGIWVATGLYIAPVATLIWVVGVGTICLAASWWSHWLDGRVYERVGQGCCSQCGYDLRGCGQSGDCPECGAWFGLGWGAAIPADRQKVLANAAAAAAAAAATLAVESIPAEPAVQPEPSATPPPSFNHPLQGL